MVVALVEGNELEIISGVTPSVGLKKGNIVNRDVTVAAKICEMLIEEFKKCFFTICVILLLIYPLGNQ